MNTLKEGIKVAGEEGFEPSVSWARTKRVAATPLPNRMRAQRNVEPAREGYQRRASTSTRVI